MLNESIAASIFVVRHHYPTTLDRIAAATSFGCESHESQLNKHETMQISESATDWSSGRVSLVRSCQTSVAAPASHDRLRLASGELLASTEEAATATRLRSNQVLLHIRFDRHTSHFLRRVVFNSEFTQSQSLEGIEGR
jgi:hypothetical protein